MEERKLRHGTCYELIFLNIYVMIMFVSCIVEYHFAVFMPSTGINYVHVLQCYNHCSVCLFFTVENGEHCDFTILRNMLIRSVQDSHAGLSISA